MTDLREARDAVVSLLTDKEDGIASLHVEIGDLRGDINEARVLAYENAIVNGENVSTARHMADHSSMHWQKELHRLEGQLAGQQAKLEAAMIRYDYLKQTG